MIKVLKFSASWCMPCKKLRDTINKVKTDFENKQLEIENIDIDDNPDKARKHQIKSLPTLIFMDDNGNEIKRLIGLFNENTIRKEFESQCQ